MAKRKEVVSVQPDQRAADKGATEEGLLTKDEVRLRLGLTSTRMVTALMQKRQIPYIKLGYRTIRFSWPRVREAIEKFEVKEVGRK